MNEQEWKKEDRPEPWEAHDYRTGSTNPPKNHNGLIAVLLVAVILLGGIVSVLGLMNIRLFKQVSLSEGQPHFSMNDQPDQTQTQATDPKNTVDVTLELNQTPTSPDNIPQAGGLPLQEIYTNVIDAVVSISCKTAGGSSSGTGVVISEDGYIVTNCHVVQNAMSVEVLFGDNRTMAAMVVGADETSDLAVLYVEATGLTPAQFGDSTALRVGDAVVAIGDPLGVALRGTMTDGIVSAINRDLTSQGRTMTLIQTNAALNSGNSGGPLLKTYGQVIGINTMKIGDYVNQAGVEGLGFAIPSATVKEVVDQLLAQGYVTGRPALGVDGETVSAFVQHYYRLPQGVYITNVVYGSAAHQAGLEPGDIIVSFGAQRITTSEELAAALYTTKAGDQVELGIYRSGRQYSLTLTVGQATG